MAPQDNDLNYWRKSCIWQFWRRCPVMESKVNFRREKAILSDSSNAYAPTECSSNQVGCGANEVQRSKSNGIINNNTANLTVDPEDELVERAICSCFRARVSPSQVFRVEKCTNRSLKHVFRSKSGLRQFFNKSSDVAAERGLRHEFKLPTLPQPPILCNECLNPELNVREDDDECQSEYYSKVLLASILVSAAVDDSCKTSDVGVLHSSPRSLEEIENTYVHHEFEILQNSQRGLSLMSAVDKDKRESSTTNDFELFSLSAAKIEEHIKKVKVDSKLEEDRANVEVNKPCACRYACHALVYDSLLPMMTKPGVIPGSYEECLAIASSCVGQWITLVERSQSLDQQYREIGLGMVKRAVMNRLAVPLTMFLEEKNTILHCWIHTPLGTRHMRSNLKGEFLTDDDPDVGKWVGVTSVVDYEIPWYCNGKSVRALQQSRKNVKAGTMIETRCILPDSTEGVIMLFNFALITKKNVRTSADRILKLVSRDIPST